MHTDGIRALFSGDYRRAIECFEISPGVFRAEGDVLRLTEGRVGLELASGLLGDIPRAIPCEEDVVGITELHGELRNEPLGARPCGVSDDHELAITLLRRSLRLARLMEHPLTFAWSLEPLAWIDAAEHHDRRAAVLRGSAAAPRADGVQLGGPAFDPSRLP